VTTVVGYHHVSLSVSNLARSTEWYQRVLGLDIIAHIEGNTFSRTRLGFPDGDHTFTLTCHRDRSKLPFNERQVGLDHIAFRVAVLEDLYELVNRLASGNIENSGLKAFSDGGAVVTLRDPDDIQLEMYFRAPG